MSLRTIGTSIKGTSALRRVTSYFIERSMWFAVEPLPGDQFTVQWKEGEPLDVTKVRQLARSVEAIAWWAVYCKPDGTLGRMGYNGDTSCPYFVQADCIAQLNLLMIHSEHANDKFYMLHVYPDGDIYTEEWLGDIGEPSDRPQSED